MHNPLLHNGVGDFFAKKFSKNFCYKYAETRRSNKSHPYTVYREKHPPWVSVPYRAVRGLFHFQNSCIMISVINSIKKCENFSSEKPFVVITFRPKSKGGKLASMCLTNGSLYSATFNLSIAYSDCTNDEGKFSAKEAWKAFSEEYSVGKEEEISCYDVAISEISEFSGVVIVATKREMREMHVAVYGDRDDALRIAKRSLERQLRQKTLKPVDTADDDDDDDE